MGLKVPKGSPGQDLTQNPEPGGLFSIEIDLFLPLDFFEILEAYWVRGLPFLNSGSTFCGFGVCSLWVRALPFVGSGSAFCGFGVCLLSVYDGIKSSKRVPARI